jgi:hypothetical protein
VEARTSHGVGTATRHIELGPEYLPVHEFRFHHRENCTRRRGKHGSVPTARPARPASSDLDQYFPASQTTRVGARGFAAAAGKDFIVRNRADHAVSNRTWGGSSLRSRARAPPTRSIRSTIACPQYDRGEPKRQLLLSLVGAIEQLRRLRPSPRGRSGGAGANVLPS